LPSGTIEIDRLFARASLLQGNDPFQVAREDKSRRVAGRLRIEQRECSLPAHPELPFPVVVRILVQVLLDGDRVVRGDLREFRIDLVTGGWRRWLRGGGADATGADRAGNERAKQRCCDPHVLAPLTRS